MSGDSKKCEHDHATGAGCSGHDHGSCACTDALAEVGKCIVVLSGKGGVGKSTLAVSLAAALKLAGKRVGLLDVDIHGPSVPKLLHLEDAVLESRGGKLVPVQSHGMRVMSIGFVLHGLDEAVIWRGPMKHKAIEQLVEDVDWGALDYLVVDCPPGTGDEPLSVIQLLQSRASAVVVTTPQDLAITDVRRSIQFCRDMSLPVLGLVENMSGLVCPECHAHIPLFKTGGGEALAREVGVPFLGKVPIEPTIVTAGDSGRPQVLADPHGEVARAFGRVARAILTPELDREPAPPTKDALRVAMPVAGGTLCTHFGHSEQFAVFDVDDAGTRGPELLVPPPHEPGVLPVWLRDQRVTTVIAGGMGARAQSLLTQHGIQVVVGAPAGEPAQILSAFLAGTLETGANTCDH